MKIANQCSELGRRLRQMKVGDVITAEIKYRNSLPRMSHHAKIRCQVNKISDKQVTIRRIK